METPQFQYHQENLAEAQRQLDVTKTSSFFKFAENSITYLYILPPWSERGLLARMVKECFLGKGQGRHTCWHTYELFGQPEMGKKDPITNVIFEAYAAKGKPDHIKRMLPNMRWYVNAIVDGVSKLGPNGEEQDNYEASIEPKQVIVGFTDATWRELDKKRRAPGVGCIYDPNATICVIVTRDDTGEITKYSTALAGNKSQGTFTPERTNICQVFESRKVGGSEKVCEIVANLNNLEERADWAMPGQDAFVEAERKAMELKATLRLPRAHLSSRHRAPFRAWRLRASRRACSPLFSPSLSPPDPRERRGRLLRATSSPPPRLLSPSSPLRGHLRARLPCRDRRSPGPRRRARWATQACRDSPSHLSSRWHPSSPPLRDSP
jgi:hypothetical protein